MAAPASALCGWKSVECLSLSLSLLILSISQRLQAAPASAVCGCKGVNSHKKAVIELAPWRHFLRALSCGLSVLLFVAAVVPQTGGDVHPDTGLHGIAGRS